MGLLLSTAHTETLAQVANVTSYTVNTFGVNALDIRNIILRMALSDGSPTTKAVVQSILAVASLHRFGPRPEAVNHKLSALETLASSLSVGIDKDKALQHIVAGMLLCLFEVTKHVPPEKMLWRSLESRHNNLEN